MLRKSTLKYLLIIILALIFKSVKAHPFYVSVAEVNYNVSNRSAEVSIKLFYDDLKRALPQIDLEDSLNYIESRSQVTKYISSHFAIKSQNSVQEVLIGLELEGNELYVYLEYVNFEIISEIEFKNSLLTDTFEDQTNIIHCKIGEVQKSLVLNKNNPTGTLYFKESE